MISPIPSHYKGTLYRSRLEARWAILFGELGIGAKYESEGFDIDGLKYLPDFWLTKGRMFVEVKPAALTPAERMKVKAIVIATGIQCLVLDGPPAVRPYQIFHAVEIDGVRCEAFACPHLLDERLYRSEGRFFSDPCLEPETWLFSDQYHAAAQMANSYRFWGAAA